MKRLHEKLESKYGNRFISKKNLVYCSVFLLVLSALFAYILGYTSRLLNIRPFVEIGKKTTTLECNYKNQRETVKLDTYSNINTYYKNSIRKTGLVENGNYSNYVYINSSDNIISDVVRSIKDIGNKRSLTDDQLVELASCFVQNIPYDDKRAQKVLSETGGNQSFTEQFPYETLFNNSGICTDKTYLASLIINELGYGTGIMLFPEDNHMALGIKVPSGYSDFGTKYTYLETTTPEFAISEVPEDISDENGKPTVSINLVGDLSIDDDPTNKDFYSGKYINDPNIVIDINDGKEYSRIIEITNLETSIIEDYQELIKLDETIELAYKELKSRDLYSKSAYNTYLSTAETTLDCGYKYDYSYNYFSPYSYSYSSPYEYRCDTVTNPAKSRAYSAYSSAVDNYNKQVALYNKLLDSYNSKADEISAQVERYKSYEY